MQIVIEVQRFTVIRCIGGSSSGLGAGELCEDRSFQLMMSMTHPFSKIAEEKAFLYIPAH